MSNKLILKCNACGAEGTIKLDDDHQIECCPSCGSALDLETDEDIDDIYGYEN